MRKVIIISILILLSTIVAQGQSNDSQGQSAVPQGIKIGGNVYGGGNKGKVAGNTNVTVKAVDEVNNVFGGARMANVGGRAYVNIDGEDATGDILIPNVYGGNDIAGTIGSSTVPVKTEDNPRGLTEVIPEPTATQLSEANKTREEWRADYKKTDPTKNDIDDSWNAFVRTSRSTKIQGTGESAKTVEDKWILVGSIYGGGNGDYYYHKTGEKTVVSGETTVTKEIYDVYLSEEDFNANKASIATINVDKGKDYLPVLGKTYLELKGGELAHVYGGGNNATVTGNTTICLNNTSDVCQGFVAEKAVKLLSNDTEGHDLDYYVKQTVDYLKSMSKLNTFQSNITSFNFNHARVFGGNNKADMAITPTWNLQRGIIRDLYSGGNEGRMTSPTGLLLEIAPTKDNNDYLSIVNVYGGCRRSDVRPLTASGEDITVGNLEGYNFPIGLAARTLVRGGKITNVYGGNDISGTVYGGNAVGIYTSILGDVYGGGNGSYAYTDNADLGKLDMYKDFYYDVNKILGKAENSSFSELESVQALNKFRPNAEQVSIRLKGYGPSAPDQQPNFTIIKGGVYCGGNSASMDSKKTNPMMEIKFGSYVIADNVFLGNNGEKMIDTDILKLYAGRVKDGEVMEANGTLSTTGGDGDYSTLNLKIATTFDEYMEGVVMNKLPDIVFDGDSESDNKDEKYIENSSYVGSFFCGGNVGSMAIPGDNSYSISHLLNIYDKFVGGCNNANIAAGTYNEAYKGGILGAKNERGTTSSTFYTDTKTENGNILDRLEINLENLTITPLRWEDENKEKLIWNTNKWETVYTAIEAGTVLEAGDKYYTYNAGQYTENTVPTGGLTADGTQFEKGQDFVEVDNDAVNVYKAVKSGEKLIKGKTYYTSSAGAGEFIATGNETANGSNYFVYNDEVRLLGGNVYGGCYNSGHVNGNVVINIKEDVLNRSQVFGKKANAEDQYPSGVMLNDQRLDVMALALTVFGAGCGEDTEIWGSTTVNLNKGYAFQIFGGGEEGVVGKKNGSGVYAFDPRYSSTVNLNGKPTVFSDTEAVSGLAESEFIYGGGNEGDVCGNTYVNLGNGRIYGAFGGASDADILGHTEMYIGRQPNGSPGTYKDGFPWIQDIVYGGNDFGGKIHGNYEDGYDFTARIRDYATDKDRLYGKPTNASPGVLKSCSYVEYLQGAVDSIFGGGYGYYDYSDTQKYGTGHSMPVQENAFVNIRPKAHDQNAVLGVFGGGTGYPGNRMGDKAQNNSYVLVDFSDNITNLRNTEVFGAGSYNGMGMFAPHETYLANKDAYSTIIDLLHGQIANAIGGSYNEGVTRRTLVNVPEGATITMYTDEPDEDEDPTTHVKTKHEKQYGNIFGGAYGTHILPPCDVYESNVNYHSSDATVKGYIFGGNNNERRTLYAHVNIYSPVYSDKEKGYTSCVFGAGEGQDTWSEYTEVNLWPGASVYEAYGGGMMGHVLNAESVQKYMQLYTSGPSNEISKKDPFWSDSSKWTLNDNGERIPNTAELKAKWADDWADAWTLGDYYKPDVDTNNDGVTDSYDYTTYVNNTATNLNNGDTGLVREAEMDDRDTKTKKYNTNVLIHEGATVSGYCYGGGYGKSAAALSGDVYGTTYIALLGGTVTKDLYAAGTSGAIYDLFGVGATGFTASANAYIKGGTVRNVYGGGWEGGVGYHAGDITTDPSGDIPGETHVVIGKLKEELGEVPEGKNETEYYFHNGIPAIQRNAYGGGEGGAVFGTANITINNGYIGYAHLLANQKFNDEGKIVAAAASEGLTERYEEKIIDETYKNKTTNAFIPNTNLYDAGCVFGGGYVDNSSVDKTNVVIYGGNIRNSAFGGGEIAAVGRGTIAEGTRSLSLYRPGKTLIEMFGGHVHRNVFGGGRGYDNLGGNGTLNADGCVFGQTEVNIHGGEIGTITGVADGDGNVFGGGDIGFVYSALEEKDNNGKTIFFKGVKIGERYKDVHQGYYFKHTWEDSGTGAGFITTTNDENIFTEDCKVLVEPNCKSSAALTFKNVVYKKGTYIPTIDYNYLKANDPTNFAKIGPDHKATADITISSRTYPSGSYVPIAALNTLKEKNHYDKETGTGDKQIWEKLDDTGITIHNAVFAGGNTPSSSVSNANTVSVYGNATASIHDVFHRDMIMLGTRHTGGLYGDGNLTTVDGYRELNITNYGTDYYSIAEEITISEYKALPKREADYYELRYTCIKECKDKEETSYRPADDSEGIKASTITADEMQTLFVVEVKDAQGNVIRKESVKDGNTPILVYSEKEGEWVPNPNNNNPYWIESGVLPIYAGRLMNSLQRADFCGVWGSRMVMQGAKDRIINAADNTNYTINRVREVSLNKKVSVAGDGVEHGNYFGIYNIVNYLGALTSDVDFSNQRVTENTDTEKYGPEIEKDSNGEPIYENGEPKYVGDDRTYYDWKSKHIKDRTRNNGSSHNKVALASGVYLELTTEESKGDSLYGKVWGPITGVVELDLINVSPGVGGGFVYAKNIHGVRQKSGRVNTTLTALNSGAATQWDYIYNPPEALENETVSGEDAKKEWQTSGNFVHSTQTIIDDCYNISNKYKSGYLPPDGVPAHYWYIKGSVYVYDQYITAYTGSSNAFSETVDIPLTIAAASHGKMKLLNVQPNRYAYYATSGQKLAADKKIIINDKTYYLNDPISYWDWNLLPASERALFVEQTYVNCITYYDQNGVEHPAGTEVMTDTEFASYKRSSHTYYDKEGNPIQLADKTNAGNEYIFRSSNNVGHDTGYILTYEVTNPSIWDNWYTLKQGDYRDKIELADYTELKSTTTGTGSSQVLGKNAYHDGPTYRLDLSQFDVNDDGILLGQQAYKEGDLIAKDIVDTYKNIPPGAIPNPAETDPDYKEKKQATFEEAYIVTEKITIQDGSSEHHYNPGTTVSKEFATANGINLTDNAAYICTNSIEVTTEDIIYKGSTMTKKDRDKYITDVKTSMGDAYKDKTLEEIKALKTTGEGAITEEKKSELIDLAILRDELETCLVQAYYCTSEGKYGGNYYEKGRNYRGLEAWSSLSKADRDMFIFNYDALDLLIDDDFSRNEGQKYQYDGNYTSEEQVKGEVEGIAGNEAGYSITQGLDYTATYNGSTTDHEADTQGGKKYFETSSPEITGGKVYVGDELSRDEFESLANEQRYYAAIVVKSGKKSDDGKYTVYVANTSFVVGGTPYALGETIAYDTYKGLPDAVKNNNVTTFVFDGNVKDNTYYYCRESYPKGTSTITPISNSTTAVISGTGGGISSDGYVELGTLISSSQYGNLPNEQKNFTIHGASPTETSTLFVSRESDIYNLSKEKIITVIYQYDYDETDGSGNVTPVSERHVLNIHLKFESGVPTIDDITPPDIILPGDYTSLHKPDVKPGAYEISGYGWELFETPRDAESHRNGLDYDPDHTPLYWYQHNWQVAYYAETYLGRSYSNAVPVSVANYHDLANVMSEKNKAHHMYIDHTGVIRDPKIYINDYSKAGQNGLDLFKDLYDLSLVTASDATAAGYTVEDGTITAASGANANKNLVGHHLLGNQTRAERNLEFFLRTDIDHSKKTVANPDYDPDQPESETNPKTITVDNPWTPIGYDGVSDNPSTPSVDEAVTNAGKCFDGVFHGDGHTISGLDHSLFNYLCGEVYNLGVTGSFTGAGIAENGGGYVESCWVKSTATSLPTGGSKTNAVFGNPSDATGYQVVNSYFWNGNKGLYQVEGDDSNVDDDKETITSGGARGKATARSAKAFYNGELAYDLNNFYLHKRYANKMGVVDENNRDDRYFTIGDDNELILQPYRQYVNKAELCSSGFIDNKNNTLKYVESRYANEDFRYAGGTIPTTKDDRYFTETVKDKDGNDVEEISYHPIYPDDYLFFGQKLTYGYSLTDAHDDVPTAVAKTEDGRLSQSENANRVYRAPAYYRNSTMKSAYFNPIAYLAQKEKLTDEQIAAHTTAREAYPYMTAIDFAGHNNNNEVTGTYQLGYGNNSTWFYPPLLDDDGLLRIQNCDETQNLLVYAPLRTTTKDNEYANEKTYDVLEGYFVDPVYTEYYDNSRGYRIVKENALSVHGHLVQNDFTAINDHLLVDKQDFNAPFGYTFDTSHRMWYQRTPDDGEYVTTEWTGTPAVRSTKGWQGISIPFTAELVTTDEKGEITHFYNSDKTNESIGHEYWLREFEKVDGTEDKIVKANLTYPIAAGDDKEYTNTFLWDYYYKNTAVHNQKDKNDDTYQTYYETSHTYKKYPLLEGKKPYIIGLPSKTFYEFDLSGSFEAENTAAAIKKLDRQTITFASKTGISIGVSDGEMDGVKKDGYTFKPSYMNYTKMESGKHAFLLNSDGNSYVETDVEEPAVVAFRPFFIASTPDGSRVTRSIIFSNDVSDDLGKDHDQRDANKPGTLNARAGRRLIAVSSTMSEVVSVRILNTAGQTLAEFDIQPGETVETRVNLSGVYVVRSDDGHFTKKLSVR